MPYCNHHRYPRALGNTSSTLGIPPDTMGSTPITLVVVSKQVRNVPTVLWGGSTPVLKPPSPGAIFTLPKRAGGFDMVLKCSSRIKKTATRHSYIDENRKRSNEFYDRRIQTLER
mmetsp:Transcript_146390/g.255697  ORF Transcript_146390/g.255697 Transcript_146390/m.255697 type:complete len:115 (+) Transcript_146390:383-727(+)